MNLWSSVPAKFFSQVTKEAQLEGRTEVDKFAFHLADLNNDGVLNKTERTMATEGPGDDVTLEELRKQRDIHNTHAQSILLDSLWQPQRELTRLDAELAQLESDERNERYSEEMDYFFVQPSSDGIQDTIEERKRALEDANEYLACAKEAPEWIQVAKCRQELDAARSMLDGVENPGAEQLEARYAAEIVALKNLSEAYDATSETLYPSVNVSGSEWAVRDLNADLIELNKKLSAGLDYENKVALREQTAGDMREPLSRFDRHAKLVAQYDRLQPAGQQPQNSF